MLLKITIILAVIFQIIAAYQAIRLTQRTKYNLSWILITIGIAALLVRRFIEFMPLVSNFQAQDFRLMFIWVGVLSSLFLALGLLLIRQIFNYIDKVETERRKAEKQILSSVIVAEESERRRLAKELHDGLGPIMSAIKMSVSSLKHQSENDAQKKIADNVDNMVQEAIKSVKDISTNLSPHMLDNFGLEKALENFINKINDSDKLNINLKTDFNQNKISGKAETIIYRVLCELITNTARHARATNAEIRIEEKNKNLLINYSDDGVGFDVEKVIENKQGMGISNIYSRIASLEGSVNINTSKKEGTEINIFIPLHHEF